MPTSTLPDIGRIVYREQAGTVDVPIAGNSVFGAKIYWGDFGTITPPTLAGGLPVQFDTATALRIGAVGDAPVANETSSGGVIGLLKALLRDLRARNPVLGQAAMGSSVPVVIASNQSALAISGSVAFNVGGGGAAAGAGNADGNTLRVVAAADASVPVLGRTTRELGALTRQAVTAAAPTLAFALPTLGPSRELWILPSVRCFLVTGVGTGMAGASPGSAYPVPVDAGWVIQVPAGHTHFSVVRDTMDGFITVAAAN